MMFFKVSYGVNISVGIAREKIIWKLKFILTEVQSEVIRISISCQTKVELG